MQLKLHAETNRSLRLI